MNELHILAGRSAALRLLSRAVDALFTGARTIPMGDNGALFRGLAVRTAAAPRAARRPTVTGR